MLIWPVPYGATAVELHRGDENHQTLVGRELARDVRGNLAYVRRHVERGLRTFVSEHRPKISELQHEQRRRADLEPTSAGGQAVQRLQSKEQQVVEERPNETAAAPETGGKRLDHGPQKVEANEHIAINMHGGAERVQSHQHTYPEQPPILTKTSALTWQDEGSYQRCSQNQTAATQVGGPLRGPNAERTARK